MSLRVRPGLLSTIEQVQQQTREWLATLRNYAVDQRDEAIADTRALLDDIDARIEVLQDRIDRRWDRMDQAARDKARAGLKELREQRLRVAEWYGRLQSSSSDAWETMKKGMSDAYRSLYGAWESAEKEFR